MFSRNYRKPLLMVGFFLTMVVCTSIGAAFSSAQPAEAATNTDAVTQTVTANTHDDSVPRECLPADKWHKDNPQGWFKTYDQEGTVTMTIDYWDAYPDRVNVVQEHEYVYIEGMTTPPSKFGYITYTEDLADNQLYAENDVKVYEVPVFAGETIYVRHPSFYGFVESPNSFCISIKDQFEPTVEFNTWQSAQAICKSDGLIQIQGFFANKEAEGGPSITVSAYVHGTQMSPEYQTAAPGETIKFVLDVDSDNVSYGFVTFLGKGLWYEAGFDPATCAASVPTTPRITLTPPACGNLQFRVDVVGYLGNAPQEFSIWDGRVKEYIATVKPNETWSIPLPIKHGETVAVTLRFGENSVKDTVTAPAEIDCVQIIPPVSITQNPVAQPVQQGHSEVVLAFTGSHTRPLVVGGIALVLMGIVVELIKRRRKMAI